LFYFGLPSLVLGRLRISPLRSGYDLGGAEECNISRVGFLD
jgi:hypothetical protein